MGWKITGVSKLIISAILTQKWHEGANILGYQQFIKTVEEIAKIVENIYY